MTPFRRLALAPGFGRLGKAPPEVCSSLSPVELQPLPHADPCSIPISSEALAKSQSEGQVRLEEDVGVLRNHVVPCLAMGAVAAL